MLYWKLGFQSEFYFCDLIPEYGLIATEVFVNDPGNNAFAFISSYLLAFTTSWPESCSNAWQIFISHSLDPLNGIFNLDLTVLRFGIQFSQIENWIPAIRFA